MKLELDRDDIMLIKSDFTSTPEDPQRLVLPGIVLTVPEDEETKAANLWIGILQIGWWYWSFNIYFAINKFK